MKSEITVTIDFEIPEWQGDFNYRGHLAKCNRVYRNIKNVLPDFLEANEYNVEISHIYPHPLNPTIDFTEMQSKTLVELYKEGEIPVRVVNACWRKGWHEIPLYELAEMCGKNDFLKIRTFGKKTLTDLEVLFDGVGLVFGGGMKNKIT